MKIFGTAAGCLLLLSSAVFSNAQDDNNPGGKPPRQEDPKPATTMPEQVKPDNPAQEDPKPAREDRSAQEQMKQSKDRDKQAQDEKKQQDQEVKRSEKEQRNERNDQKSGQEQNRNSANDRASGNNRDRHQASQRIPDDKFKAHFGREHHFHVSQPVIVANRPRFQYSGFWFEFVDPWPVGWSYTDDCYIDYIDGEYFLFDVLHSETRIAVIVVI